MSWLKHVLVDLVVTLAIILAAALSIGWLRWIVVAYTALMVLLKAVAFGGSTGATGQRLRAPGVPDWFFHALYGINVGVSGAAAWTTGSLVWALVAGGWLLIWGLSFLAEHRARTSAKARR